MFSFFAYLSAELVLGFCFWFVFFSPCIFPFRQHIFLMELPSPQYTMCFSDLPALAFSQQSCEQEQGLNIFRHQN